MANAYVAPGISGFHTWTFDADGNGQSVVFHGGYFYVGIGSASGFGGGTLSWQWSLDSGTTWCNITSSSSTAATNGTLVFSIGQGNIRPVLAGATTPTITVFAR